MLGKKMHLRREKCISGLIEAFPYPSSHEKLERTQSQSLLRGVQQKEKGIWPKHVIREVPVVREQQIHGEGGSAAKTGSQQL